MGIRVFMVREECEKSFFYKTGSSGDSLATKTSREFQSQNNWLARLSFFVLQCSSCHDPLASCMLHMYGILASHQLQVTRKFQSPSNRMARLYFLSYNDPAILTLQLPACFTCVHNSSESPLASQSRVPITRMLLGAHT